MLFTYKKFSTNTISMKIVIRVNYVTNLYMHVENLACYHGFTDKSYSKFFKIKPSKLLKRYEALKKKRFFDRTFEQAFTNNNLSGTLRHLNKILVSREKGVISDIIRKYDDHSYRGSWQANKTRLFKIKQGLEKEFSKYGANISALLHQILKTDMPEKLNVFLCWNPVEYKATVLGQNNVLVEIPEYVEDVKSIFSVVVHEIFHIVDTHFGKNCYEILKQHFDDKKALEIYEGIAELFAPNGILVNYELKGRKSAWNKKVGKIKGKIKPIFDRSLNEGKDFYAEFLPDAIQQFK